MMIGNGQAPHTDIESEGNRYSIKEANHQFKSIGLEQMTKSKLSSTKPGQLVHMLMNFNLQSTIACVVIEILCFQL